MYNIIMETIRFEWDEEKNRINRTKHGSPFSKPCCSCLENNISKIIQLPIVCITTYIGIQLSYLRLELTFLCTKLSYLGSELSFHHID